LRNRGGETLMTELSAYPITKRWPPADPTRIQLYSLPTPNGVKASIMLEETGLPYEVAAWLERRSRGRWCSEV
jgi:hypothetical protein